jgi:PKHD-type hydroxylase
MNGEWCYYKSFFDKKTCENIIKDAQKIPSQAGQLGNGTNTLQDNSIRRSEIRFANKGDPDFQHVFNSLWKNAMEANEQFFGFHISKLEFIQIAKYDSSYKGEYKSHHDVFWLNDDPKNHRKLSCIIQLSDPNDYDGGDLEINEASEAPSREDIRQQGTMIFFPSFLRHQANPVTRGTRYSIAAWFEGPKWR